MIIYIFAIPGNQRSQIIKVQRSAFTVQFVQVNTSQHDWCEPYGAIVWKKIRTKVHEFEDDEEEEKSGTTDRWSRDQDAEKKKRGAEAANRRAESKTWQNGTRCCYCKGNKTSCLQHMIQIHTV